jgi:type III restriction enzyme
MHRQVNAIAGRLSLRPPQRRSLEILDRVTEILPPQKGTPLDTALAILHREFPTVTDESHRYRASAGVRAINELRPVLGLELTATPFVETTRGPVDFKNVLYDYPLGKALADGFIKEPAVVTQWNFDASQFTPAQLEEIKLQDGIRLHENTKVELETCARQTGQPIVKPFMLLIARDTAHASQLLQLIQSDQFFERRYKDKVNQVDSSRTGAEEDAMVQRLLVVESYAEPTEIVIHGNMLKEGWDVTNLYTIVPLRAAHARILIEQSIGRGLRLPYGRRPSVAAVDRLSIVAHDKFQEIIDEANRPDSPIRLQQVILDPKPNGQRLVTVVRQSNLAAQIAPATLAAGPSSVLSAPPSVFTTEVERRIARVTYEVIQRHESLPSSTYLLQDEVQPLID